MVRSATEHYDVERHVLMEHGVEDGWRTLRPVVDGEEWYVNGKRVTRQDVERIVVEVEAGRATAQCRLFEKQPTGELRTSDFGGCPPYLSKIKPTTLHGDQLTAGDFARIHADLFGPRV